MTSKQKQVWALAEHSGGIVKPITYEIAAFAWDFADRVNYALTMFVIGHPVNAFAEEIARNTGCDVVGIDSESTNEYNAEIYHYLIKQVSEKDKPSYIFIPHTATGWDFAPALAVDIGASCITAISGVRYENGPIFVRDICNGKLREDVRPLPDVPAVVTVMPGTAQPSGVVKTKGKVTILEIENPHVRTKTLGFTETPRASLNLQEADVIVSAGRGVGGPDRLGPIKELASLFERGAVGASRPVCDAGWMPLDAQVGMTGQTVSPKLYIACGISGAIQHTMGMKGAKLIIVINTDKNSMFCKTADYCVVADLHKFIPVLIEKIRRHKAGKSGDT